MNTNDLENHNHDHGDFGHEDENGVIPIPFMETQFVFVSGRRIHEELPFDPAVDDENDPDYMMVWNRNAPPTRIRRGPAQPVVEFQGGVRVERDAYGRLPVFFPPPLR